jgi:hypothetical protein
MRNDDEPGRTDERREQEERIVKKWFYISFAVAALLVLATGGWTVKALRSPRKLLGGAARPAVAPA